MLSDMLANPELLQQQENLVLQVQIELIKLNY